MKFSTIRNLLPIKDDCPIVKYGSALHNKIKNEDKTYIYMKRCKKGNIFVRYCGGNPPSGWMGNLWSLSYNNIYLKTNYNGTGYFIFPVPKYKKNLILSNNIN